MRVWFRCGWLQVGKGQTFHSSWRSVDQCRLLGRIRGYGSGKNDFEHLPFEDEDSIFVKSVVRFRSQGKTYTILGTARDSKRSSLLAEKIISKVKPETVVLELEKDGPHDNEALMQISKERPGLLRLFWLWHRGIRSVAGPLFGQARMSLDIFNTFSTQTELDKLIPFLRTTNLEMVRAHEVAKSQGAKIVYADRPYQVSLKRFFLGSDNFTQRIFLCSLPDLFFPQDPIPEGQYEKFLNFCQRYPPYSSKFAYKFFTYERALCFIHSLRNCSAQNVVGVFSFPHLPIILTYWNSVIPFDNLLSLDVPHEEVFG